LLLDEKIINSMTNTAPSALDAEGAAVAVQRPLRCRLAI
jgi:hypothetical protein